SETIAVGVSFSLSEKRASSFADADAVRARVLSGAGADDFEKLLHDLCRQSDVVHLRLQAEARRLELVSLTSPSGRQSAQPPALEITLLPPQLEHPPVPGEYIEIGDTDYSQLLREEGGPAAEIKAPKTGEVLVEALQVSGIKLNEEGAVVKGVTENRLDDETRV